jgi:osmotically-inducible protein OsmY
MVMTAAKDDGQLSYPYGRASTDEEVLSSVLNALHHCSGVPQDDVRVEVHDGHAVLSGVVAEAFERELAEKTAAETPGVVEVTNRITVAN